MIDAFTTPKLTYAVDTKTFLASRQRLRLHSESADPKAAVFRERFNVLKQRTLRHKLFKTKLEGSSGPDSYTLTPLSALLGHTRYKADENGLVVIGMIVQLEEGKYYLEDLDGKVRLSLADVQAAHGLYTENSIVIAEGGDRPGLLVPPHLPRRPGHSHP